MFEFTEEVDILRSVLLLGVLSPKVLVEGEGGTRYFGPWLFEVDVEDNDDISAVSTGVPGNVSRRLFLTGNSVTVVVEITRCRLRLIAAEISRFRLVSRFRLISTRSLSSSSSPESCWTTEWYRLETISLNEVLRLSTYCSVRPRRANFRPP